MKNSSEMNAIGILNELGPSVKTNYDFTDLTDSEGFLCILKLTKDRETFDTYGIGRRKQDAKEKAAQQMAAMLKLVFPMIPLAVFSGAIPIISNYYLADEFIIASSTLGFDLTELKSGSVRVYLNVADKTYTIPKIDLSVKLVNASCPIELLNDPVRFTDWSQGPVCIAQHNYIKRRVELYCKNLH